MQIDSKYNYILTISNTVISNQWLFKTFYLIAGFNARYKLNNYEITQKLLMLDQKYYCKRYSCLVGLLKDNLNVS